MLSTEGFNETTAHGKMATSPADGGDSFGEPFTVSPENTNITSQPQPQDTRKQDGHRGCGLLKQIPFSTVLHEGKGHQGARSLDCPQCGQDVASILVTRLSLGDRDLHSPQALQFRDVMVLTHDTKIGDFSGMVQGLRDASIPVRVVSEEEADVMRNLADLNEVLVVWRGLVCSETARRVMVICQPEASAPPTSPPYDIRPVLRPADHIIWVRQSSDATPEDVSLDVEDHVLLEETQLLGEKRSEAQASTDQNYNDTQSGNPHLAVDEEDEILKEENRKRLRALMDNPYLYNQYKTSTQHKTTTSYNGPSTVDSRYNANNCCDEVCLACSQDVGESGCILCCPCCDLCSLCEDCCRGFGHGLNHCIQALCCDCCTSGGGGSGCDCGDCDCGDCDCDCGSCDCDCGSCDCVIM